MLFQSQHKKYRATAGTGFPLGTCRDIQGYHFSYDAANRLRAATSWERTSGSPTINNKYSEPLINYDLCR